MDCVLKEEERNDKNYNHDIIILERCWCSNYRTICSTG